MPSRFLSIRISTHSNGTKLQDARVLSRGSRIPAIADEILNELQSYACRRLGMKL